MSEITNFIATLVKGANDVHRLSEFERARLFDRAYHMVRDIREAIGTSPGEFERDPAIDFMTMARSTPMFDDDEIKSGLLEAAGVLRTLRILLDAKVETIVDGGRKG